MSLRVLALFAACFLFVIPVAVAQDPFSDFGDGENGAGAPVAAPERRAGDSEDVDLKERDAVVLSLRRDPPRDAIGIAKALQWMVRIRRWDEAGRWLDKLGAGGMSPAVARQIVDAIGAKPLLDLEMQLNGLTDTQRAAAARIRMLAAQALQDPGSLASSVSQLRSPSKGDRLTAYEALKAAGAPGITAMLNAMLDENAQPPSNSMVEAFSLLGDQAPRAWQVAMTTPHADARKRLVALVAPLPKPKMGCELMAELYDPSVTDAVRDSLERSLRGPQSQMPSVQEVNRFALDLVEQSLNEYRRRSRLNEVDTEIEWVLAQNGRSLNEGAAIPAMLALTRASQAAQIAVRLIPQSDLASATAIAAHWEYLTARGAVDATGDATFRNALPESLRDSPEFACLVWDAALSNRLSGAQAVAIGNLSRWEGAGIPGAVRERLVAATRSGLAMVRYPAAVALMKSRLEASAVPADTDPLAKKSPPAGFQGSSRVDAVATEMRQLSSEPVALIVGGNEGLRGHMHGLLDQFGYRLFEAATAAEAFQLLRSGLPIEAVFIIEHVRDLDLGQLVQRIRANPTTSTVPVAMLADSLSRGEHSVAEEDHRVVMGSVPPTLEALGDITARMRGVSDPPPLTIEARILFKDSADNYFQANAAPPALQGAGSSEPRWAATQEEQNQLLRILADRTESELKREQASRNFVQSVRRFGLLITSETAQSQYDVYNLRGESEPVTRAVVGRAIDAIEASNGQRSWAEVAP
ncbi:MAG: hypothetical protein ACK6DC_06210 [Planctomycetota bacterium]